MSDAALPGVGRATSVMEGCMYADFSGLGVFWDGERSTKVDVHSTYIYILKQ